MIKSTF